jgi:transcription termination factor Rho
MTAEQQLERSVLEGKERDELHAIAQALSVKTNTRTKKADMIDGILKATGVSVDDGARPEPSSHQHGDGERGARPATDGGGPPLSVGRSPPR